MGYGFAREIMGKQPENSSIDYQILPFSLHFHGHFDGDLPSLGPKNEDVWFLPDATIPTASAGVFFGSDRVNTTVMSPYFLIHHSNENDHSVNIMQSQG